MPNKKSSGLSADLLRRAGFTEGADGSWSKVDPAAGDPSRGANPEPDAKRQLEGKPRPQGKDARCDRQGARILILATVVTVRPRDYDGLGAAVKGIIDRLVELRRIPVDDDDPDSLEVVCVSGRCAHFKDQKTIIEIFDLS